MSIYEYRPAMIFFIVLAAAIGGIAGSFLNCAAWRIVRGESFTMGRSRCPSCGHTLGAAELIPVCSWLFQKGRCKWCKEKISVRYPLTELAFALITVLCLLRFDLTVLCLRNFLFLCCLFLLTLTDLEDMIIPDGCHIAAAAAWAAAMPFTGAGWTYAAEGIAAALVYGGGVLLLSLLMDKMTGRDTLGGGDIKLLAVTGLYLGLIGTLFALIIACAAGLLFQAAVRRGGRGKAFPFGPWIAFGAAVMLLYGEPLIRWYKGLLWG